VANTNLPYIVYGVAYDTDGTTALNSATIRLRNETNGQIISTTSNSSGQFVLDAANFSSGYLTGDNFNLYVIYANGEDSETISTSEDDHNQNLTLTTVTDSNLINYCTVQDVWDELGDKTSSDITARRIIKAVQRAEAEIDEKAKTKFTSTTITQEIYDFNQYNSWSSPEVLQLWGNAVVRQDHWTANFNDSIMLKGKPIISVTTLQKNTAGSNQTDSWTTLTEQTGISGDYILYKDDKNILQIDKRPGPSQFEKEFEGIISSIEFLD